MILRIVFFLMLIGCSTARLMADGGNTSPKVTISGYVKDAENGEALIGATVYVKELKIGTSVNQYGFYSISLPQASYTLTFNFVGYKIVERKVDLKANTTLNIELASEEKQIDEVVVSADRPDKNIKKAEMSVAKLGMKTIRKIPALMGEVDVIKAIQMLPGVVPTAEGTSGFSVRGGGIDQNLIILDEAPVYNASHMMGFFSVFNNDAIRDVKLYKGDIPANFGGRLSSVLDVHMKEGNNKKFSGAGGIGLISSRLTLEGPVGSEKTSFLISGRRTYADLFFPLFSDSSLRKSKMYFYDLNLKINHQIDNDNRIFLSAYLGRDKFGQKGTSDVGFGNKTVTARWNHLYSQQLFSNLTAIVSNYDYSLYMEASDQQYSWKSSLLDYSLKLDFNYFLNPQNEIRFGIVSTLHNLEPCNAWETTNNTTLTIPYPKNYELEHAFYLNNEQKVGEKLTLKYGFRLSVFQNIGPGTVYSYDQSYNVIDTVTYSSGKIFHIFPLGFEPRLGLNYTINDEAAIKASYSRTIQYLQLASNSNGGMPLDVWFTSSPNVKPQNANQFSLGYFRNFHDNMFETSIETFYKKMNNVIDFKNHAVILMNPRMEGEIRTGTAEAYGAEFLVRKNEGKLNGWISYTYSRSFRKIDALNNGKRYPSPYDKPNNINIILNYEVSKKVSVSANWVYATGAPFTGPVKSMTIGNDVVSIYADRNSSRLRDYHRLDLSLTLEGKNYPGKLWHGEWVFSIYNVYMRHNDWIINFVTDSKSANPNEIKAQRMYLPFLFFPSITYNFNF